MDRESEIQGLKVSHPVMRAHARLACSICVIFLLSGCAGLSGPLAGTGDISGDRIERKADVVRSFDLKRERAQYEAALGRWRGGDTSGCQTILIELLERRLDAVIYRMKFVPTVFAARQFINHGHIQVNGKRVNIPSFRVKDGDVITVKEKSRELPLVLDAIVSPERETPDYMDVNFQKMQGTLLRGPRHQQRYPGARSPRLHRRRSLPAWSRYHRIFHPNCGSQRAHRRAWHEAFREVSSQSA